MNALKRAAEILREDAESIRQSHTLGGDWQSEDKAKAEHDEMLAVAEKLDALNPVEGKDNAAQQAQIWAQEASTPKGIAEEIGTLVGCSNDWEMVSAVKAALSGAQQGEVVGWRNAKHGEHWPHIGAKYLIRLKGVLQHEIYEFDQGDDGFGGGEYFWDRHDLDEGAPFNPEKDEWLPIDEAGIPAAPQPAQVPESTEIALGFIKQALSLPSKPLPDPHAHSHEAYARALHEAFCAIRFKLMHARDALTAAPSGEARWEAVGWVKWFDGGIHFAEYDAFIPQDAKARGWRAVSLTLPAPSGNKDEHGDFKQATGYDHSIQTFVTSTDDEAVTSADGGKTGAAWDGLREVAGCFDAALSEGWVEALAGDDIESIRDIWLRRIHFAYQAATALLAAPSGDAKREALPPIPYSQHEKECGKLIDERDHAQDWADKLAGAIGEHFGIDIGDHSSCNCPWETAFDTMPNSKRQVIPPHMLASCLYESARCLGVAQAKNDKPAIDHWTEKTEALLSRCLRKDDAKREAEIKAEALEEFAGELVPRDLVQALPALCERLDVAANAARAKAVRLRQSDSDGGDA